MTSKRIGILRELIDDVVDLERENKELRAELARVVEHLESWARDHSMEASTETWGALYCAHQLLNRKRD